VRACIQLQNLESSLFDVARDLGYPDGFSLSNQLRRLTGVRPSLARDHLGWEWIVERWVEREALGGGFTGDYAALLMPAESTRPAIALRPSKEMRSRAEPASRPRRALRVGEP
jgi:hypothetical protein